MAQVGKWAFIVGLVVAAVGGIGFGQAWFGWVLVLLGLVVGFMNVSDSESFRFLVAAIALIVAANAVAGLPYIGGYATNIIANVIAFMSAAVLVVALKSLFELAKD
jgi:ATP synthase protein I